jgi:hypothetical protein
MTTESGDRQSEVNEVSEVEGYLNGPGFVPGAGHAADGGGVSTPATIHIESFSWGASSPSSMGYGSGGGTGKVAFHDFSIM